MTLRHKLSRPAFLGSVDSAADAYPHPDMHVTVTSDAGETAVAAEVDGVAGSSSADRLVSRLLAASRGGTLPLVVDLSRVSYLDSAGVRALCQVSEQLAAQGQELRLVAPCSGSAYPMLELAGLDACAY